MAKSRVLEDTLAELHRLRADPTSPSALATLRRVLGGKLSHAVAKAAQIAGEFEIGQLTPELVAAFDRFMINPVKTDPGCRAKAEIAEALYRIGYDAERLFLYGIRHVQMEPVYGGKTDTAAALRSACALGLVRVRYADVMTELADLLADPESSARIAAVRAIAYSESDHGVPLLRLKVLTDDDHPEVVSECLSALLQIAPASSLAFVARLLDTPDTSRREMAALALGGSRLPEAFDVLHQWWDRTPDPDLRRTALLAIAMLKHDRPIEFLLSLIAEAAGPTARDAIAALGLYRHDEALRERVRRAAARDDVDLRAAVVDAFEEA
jgi:HEAT repeat protein